MTTHQLLERWQLEAASCQESQLSVDIIKSFLLLDQPMLKGYLSLMADFPESSDFFPGDQSLRLRIAHYSSSAVGSQLAAAAAVQCF